MPTLRALHLLAGKLVLDLDVLAALSTGNGDHEHLRQGNGPRTEPDGIADHVAERSATRCLPTSAAGWTDLGAQPARELRLSYLLGPGKHGIFRRVPKLIDHSKRLLQRHHDVLVGGTEQDWFFVSGTDFTDQIVSGAGFELLN